MPQRLKYLFVFLVLPAFCLAQIKVKLVRVDPGRETPPRIYVSFSGDPASDKTVLLDRTLWKVWMSDKADGVLTPVDVDDSPDAVSIPSPQILKIQLKGLTIKPEDMLSKVWTAQLNQSNLPALVLKSTPRQLTKCDGKTPGRTPFLCPPAAGAPADISVSGSFLAGGGTKPIYSLELIGGLYAAPLPALAKFSPGVSTTIEINQNKKPPNNRTTFDPDSIVAALALQRMVPLPSGKRGTLYGLEFDESLPSGEFSRSDPTSNIIFASTAQMIFKPIRKGSDSRAYGTVFPMFGIEAGKNLNKPRTIAKTAVDLSRYDAVLRGYSGIDAAFGIMSKDTKTDDLTISGSYRVRLPAFAEPFVETLHQVTTVTLTTKARNWFEGNINYAPWSFKYLTLNAKYQYGELPPLFTLVDHKFTFGITFKAVQSNKPNVQKMP